MSLAFIISLAIQVILIVHCIRTGRNWLWMLAIGLLSLWLRVRRQLYSARWFHWLATAAGPAGFIAIFTIQTRILSIR